MKKTIFKVTTDKSIKILVMPCQVLQFCICSYFSQKSRRNSFSLLFFIPLCWNSSIGNYFLVSKLRQFILWIASNLAFPCNIPKLSLMYSPPTFDDRSLLFTGCRKSSLGNHFLITKLHSASVWTKHHQLACIIDLNMSAVSPPEMERCPYMQGVVWRKSYLTDGAFRNLVAVIATNSASLILNILLNVLVILAVTTRRPLRTKSNILLACLAGSDLLAGP